MSCLVWDVGDKKKERNCSNACSRLVGESSVLVYQTG